MINNSEFSKRLKIIIDYYELSASSFAEKIKVQRSSISHLLSGRNKPSLDFVLKVLDNFKEVEMYWLLKGVGEFPKKEKKLDYPTSLFPEDNELDDIKDQINDNKIDVDINKEKILVNNTIKSEIDKIVIFYRNGTFKTYNEII